VLLTPGQARVLEHDEKPPQEVYSLVERPDGKPTLVSATIKLLRPIPMRSGRRGSYRSYSQEHTQPSYDELGKAGPERAVEVELMSQSMSVTSNGVTSRMQVWPLRPPQTNLPFIIESMDQATVERVLPVLGPWTLEMSGDTLFAEGVLAGGTPRPVLAGASVFEFRQWLPIAGAVFIVLSFVFNLIRRGAGPTEAAHA
jgi:hypothetical protein